MEKRFTEKWKLIVDIAIFVLVVYLDAINVLPISQTIYLVPLIFLILRVRKETFASIGWGFGGANVYKQIALGVLIGVLMELFAIFVLSPMINGYFGTSPDLTELSEIKGNLVLLVIYLALSWLLGAFGEEICFRGFLMNRIAGLFQNTKLAWFLAVVLSSILFGWGHTEQGVSGWVQEGINAILLGVVFISSNKRLPVPIVAHGVSNTLALVLIYLGQYPGVY
ncbi:CPBP family intramembrane metalloprotease [Muricauda sp. 2012CJ35-5]|uniref:CPBP family intramembrane metalloprotease n=1 Tax=Flagellimonas spongiicola TaxID=2942208 RepID=A0ABT0PR24_9FLAO|nr:CPBP family intramembrane glutamic endopeptidase [Allomuricauda spongiicola]MCL6273842.1 CPBP family intramembrane metalloprotease [Allomuricauda spongiicola]